MTPLEAVEVYNRLDELTAGKDGYLALYRMPKSYTIEIKIGGRYQHCGGKTLLDALRKAGAEKEKGRGKK